MVVRWTVSWQAFSVSAPTKARTLYQVTFRLQLPGAPIAYPLWTDTAGGTVIVYWASQYGKSRVPLHFGSISGGRYSPLPDLPGLDVGDGLPSITW
jgi:hypothetical protein